MLRTELSGKPYNKADHRRRLLPLLANRSEAAVERKHGNISAVLIALGFPYIAGYKPYDNFQGLLYEVVEDRLQRAQSPRELVAADVDGPARIPRLNNILQAQVQVPVRRTPPPAMTPGHAWGARRPGAAAVDYLAREARNARLGLAGEHFVIEFERARLLHEGRESLASQVEHVSKAHGDGAGLDILSFDASGRERLVEVKTTRYGALTPFYATQNEVSASEASSDQYCVYRVHEFRVQPRLFVVRGAISERFEISPRVYSARITFG